MTWVVVQVDTPGSPFAHYHVIPEDDLREHIDSESCWCKPTEDAQEAYVIHHHSLDGREAFETGDRKPS